MFNSKQMKIARKAVAKITNPMVMNAAVGSIEDIKSGVHPANSAIIPLWGAKGTIAAVTAMDSWDTNPEVVDHIVGGILGRFGHFLMREAGLDLQMASFDQAIELMTPTDALQEQVVKQLVGAEKYDAYKAKLPQPGSVKF